ncbi:unnamed protein product, partial [Brassica rapa subsp. trilocularis]
CGFLILLSILVKQPSSVHWWFIELASQSLFRNVKEVLRFLGDWSLFGLRLDWKEILTGPSAGVYCVCNRRFSEILCKGLWSLCSIATVLE